MGLGRFSAHWSGDNGAYWEYLQASIPGNFNFQIFGIPFVGADICGFIGSTNEELCARWSALGAFYPFSRNHHDHGAQEPYLWESVARVSRKVLAARYSLLPYLFTLFRNANTFGGTVARPLSFEWQDDKETWPIDKQFMLGMWILVSPVVIQGDRNVWAYFPPGEVWYNFWNLTRTPLSGWTNLPCPLEDIHVHIRGGVALAMQTPLLTIFETQQQPFTLLVALTDHGGALGNFYRDDDDLAVGTFATDVQWAAGSDNDTSSWLYSSTRQATQRLPVPPITTVTILGVKHAVVAVTLNGAAISSFTYDAARQQLSITKVSIALSKDFTLRW